MVHSTTVVEELDDGASNAELYSSLRVWTHCLSYVTRLGGVKYVGFGIDPELKTHLKYHRRHPNTVKACLRNTNLKTSLARVTLLLLASVDTDLASR